MGLLIDPLVSFDLITEDQLNDSLERWGHQMGPLTRPRQYGGGAHGLRHDGQLVAVTAWSTLIRENCAGMDFLPRSTTTELSRVCAARPDLCRVVVRLWREFVFPAVSTAHGHEWAVSYQDGHLHSGDLYRNDGWVKLGQFQSGGHDPRTGRRGRSGFVWGWHPARAVRLAHQALPKLRKAWCRDTSYWPARWSPQNRAAGQCAVTAIFLQSKYGGEILQGKIGGEDHYWNRIEDEDIDLTRSQFGPGRTAFDVRRVPAQLLLANPSTAHRYNLLLTRIAPVPTLARAAA